MPRVWKKTSGVIPEYLCIANNVKKEWQNSDAFETEI